MGLGQGARGVFEQRGSPALIPARFCVRKVILIFLSEIWNGRRGGLLVTLLVFLCLSSRVPIKKQVHVLLVIFGHYSNYHFYCSFHSTINCFVDCAQNNKNKIKFLKVNEIHAVQLILYLS